jgi:hypothetical protein
MMASATAASGVPRGTTTATGTPARAPYTAAAPPALPAEGIIKPFTPRVRALVTAIPSPRALKEPVGFCPSSLPQRRPTPTCAASRGSSSSGVLPSPSATGSSPSTSGTSSRNRYIPGGRNWSESLVTAAATRARS